MPMFKIGVEKKVRSTSYVVLDAESPSAAIKSVREQINNGTLKMENIAWEENFDEVDSLKTYGEVSFLENQSHTYEDTVNVLAHEISFWFRGEQPIDEETKELLKEEAENRANTCINDGYVSGELNYEDGEKEYRGWWEIKRD